MELTRRANTWGGAKNANATLRELRRHTHRMPSHAIAYHRARRRCWPLNAGVCVIRRCAIASPRSRIHCACCPARRGSRFSISPTHIMSTVSIRQPGEECWIFLRAGRPRALRRGERTTGQSTDPMELHGGGHGINSRASRAAGIARPRSSSGTSCLCIPSAIPPRSLFRAKGRKKASAGSFGSKFLERIAW
jgi:hypothetical protein